MRCPHLFWSADACGVKFWGQSLSPAREHPGPNVGAKFNRDKYAMASESNKDKENQDIENESTPVISTEEDQTTLKDTVTEKNYKESSGDKDQVTPGYPLQPKPPVVRFSSHKGDNCEQVEVIEYTDTEVMDPDSSADSSLCVATAGPHIALMTVLLIPVAFFPSLTVAFYYGAWTWWKIEFLDFEKGFYGWLCCKIGLPMCSPYEVLEYTDDSELQPMRA
ncbi:uncharacterized protein LOC134266915 [Saccostrea cucullata]|uniref:uncharacterized protein LOC134266915 n=1 Tax=Saccostrea cuccullata TaxID=36930 RepID=UPI002ED5AC63